MAVHDWNGDGKIDMLDDAAEFQAIHSAAGNRRQASSSGGCGTCILILFFAILPWIITGLVMMKSGNEMEAGGILFCLIGSFALEIALFYFIGRMRASQ